MTDSLDYSIVLRRFLRLIPTIGMATLGVLFVSFILDYQKEVSAGPASSPLGLRVVSKPQQIQIFWNHDSSAIQAAERGSIQISDGGFAEWLPFDASQLLDGSLVYRARSNDVSVRMEVDESNGRHVSESVRAVRTP